MLAVLQVVAECLDSCAPSTQALDGSPRLIKRSEVLLCEVAPHVRSQIILSRWEKFLTQNNLFLNKIMSLHDLKTLM